MSRTNHAIRWARRNLFASTLDSALTLSVIPLCLWAAGSLLDWAFFGANWSVVGENLRVLMVGTFPASQMDRAWVSAGILLVLSGATLGAACTSNRRVSYIALLATATATLVAAAAPEAVMRWTCVCIGLATAGFAAANLWSLIRRFLGLALVLGVIGIAIALSPAGTDRWGGLLMSVLVTLMASVLSVPLGVALAFGRRSRYASVRIICTGYIEVMRSLPLILVVYWVWLITPLLAQDLGVPDLVRGLFGFSIFFSAYVAEYVRSGLQSIPRGQIEAARSLGMSPFQVNRDVVLPQATRVVLPALVGNVLDIFNTVPLLFIIGLTDFLRAGQMVLINPQSGGSTYEIYLFMFVVYLAIASLITYESRRLEARMALANK